MKFHLLVSIGLLGFFPFDALLAEVPHERVPPYAVTEVDQESAENISCPITVSQYCEFLNDGASSDSYQFYNKEMNVKRSKVHGGYVYSVNPEKLRIS